MLFHLERLVFLLAYAAWCAAGIYIGLEIL